MKQKYILCDNEPIGVKQENTIIEKWFTFNNFNLKVMVTKERDYYNFYMIDDYFKKEPLNNLNLQEPLKYFDEKSTEEKNRFIEELALSHYLWFKYNRYYNIQSQAIEV